MIAARAIVGEPPRPLADAPRQAPVDRRTCRTNHNVRNGGVRAMTASALRIFPVIGVQGPNSI